MTCDVGDKTHHHLKFAHIPPELHWKRNPYANLPTFPERNGREIRGRLQPSLLGRRAGIAEKGVIRKNTMREDHRRCLNPPSASSSPAPVTSASP